MIAKKDWNLAKFFSTMLGGNVNKKEMVLLESCVRLALWSTLDKNNRDTLLDLTGIIHNVSGNAFVEDGKANEESSLIDEELNSDLKKHLLELLLKIQKCDKSFNGYMII